MMVNNGKYASGGMIMNPFASLNDGLIDITWIQDPSMQGTFGVTGVFSDAGGRGGIQAYKGHSQYVRGRTIRIEVPEKTPSAELDLAPEQDSPEAAPQEGEAGATATPAEAATATETATPAATPAAPAQQVVVIDGEPLHYEKAVQWDCMPGNIEVLIDDCYFTAGGTFEHRITAEVEKDRIIAEIVNKIWVNFDRDNSGELNKEETRLFLKSCLVDMQKSHYDESAFEEIFDQFDANHNGTIEKEEMTNFIKALL